MRLMSVVCGSALVLGLSGSASGEWIREVVDPDPMFGAQGLSASAVDVNGKFGVVYRKRDGSGMPSRLVLATRGATGWDVESILPGTFAEEIGFNDSINVGGEVYAAVSINNSSLRILRRNSSGWSTVFDSGPVGSNFGGAIKLGTFDGRLAAVYTGRDGGSSSRTTHFLYQSASGQFVQETANQFLQDGTVGLDFVQIGREVVIANGRSFSRAEFRRGESGVWTEGPMGPGTTISTPSITRVANSLFVFDTPQSLSGSNDSTVLLTNAGLGWFQSVPFGPQLIHGPGSDWFTVGGRTFLTYSGGPTVQGAQVYLSELVGGRLQPRQSLGTGFVESGFANSISSAVVGGIPMISAMSTTLPSGLPEVVVFRQIPEPTLGLLVVGVSAVLGSRVGRRRCSSVG